MIQKINFFSRLAASGGGAGHISDMIARLKMNKAQRRGRTPYLVNPELRPCYGNESALEFKEASQKGMVVLNAEIHKDRHLLKRNTRLAALITVVQTIAIVALAPAV